MKNKQMSWAEAKSFLEENSIAVTEPLLRNLTGIERIICLGCGESKKFTQFHKDNKSKTGRRIRCIACNTSNEHKKKSLVYLTRSSWGCDVQQTPEAIIAHQKKQYGTMRYESVKLKPAPRFRGTPSW